MIRFIDITTGNVFNGSQPYVFWFDKEQSVNLNYVRKICVLTTSQYLTASIPENDIFCLLDVDRVSETIEISKRAFKDLDDIKTFSIDSEGASYREFYIHMFYFLGHSSDAGEFREQFTLADTDKQESFNIGADFYNEREELYINLLNQGAEIPKAVEKAIYEFNVHEEGIDNILLNRKYKELLSEYINIIGNKGSYKSLINSLKWFEYGDLVKISDYWKHHEAGKDMYSEHDLSQLVDKDIEYLISQFHKTTYIGLHLALTKVAKDSKGDIEYLDSIPYWDEEIDRQTYGDQWQSAHTQQLLSNEHIDRLLQIGEGSSLVSFYDEPVVFPVDDSENTGVPGVGSNWMRLRHQIGTIKDMPVYPMPEPIPEIDYAASKWGAIDLSLKMTLLGNFFSTYFMPLHLDLIHSTVENIIFTDTIKIFHHNTWHRQDWNHDIESFHCQLEDTYYISDVQARVYRDTTFGDQWEAGKEYEDMNIFGVETEDRDSIFDNDEIKTFLSQRFEGPAAIIPFHCVLPRVQKGMCITEAIALVYKDGMNDPQVIKSYTIKNTPEEVREVGDRHIDFNLLFKEIGEYKIAIDFKCGSSMHYIKSFAFKIKDNINQEIKLYNIHRRDWSELKDINLAEQTDLVKFMFTQLNGSSTLYHQFLATNDQAFLKKLGLNQVIVYEPQVEWNDNLILKYYFKFGSNEYSKIYNSAESGSEDFPSDLNDFISVLNKNYPKYRFFRQDRLYPNPSPESESEPFIIIPYIFGLCLQFDMKKDIILLNNQKAGAVKGPLQEGSLQDLVYCTLKLDVDSMAVRLFLESDSKDPVTTKAYAYSDGEFGWKEFDSLLPDQVIIDDHIKIQLTLPHTGVTKELDIEVPKLMNLQYATFSTPMSIYNTIKVDGKKYNIVKQGFRYISQGIVKDQDITNKSVSYIGRLFLQHLFISPFHKSEEMKDRIISQDDVVYFAPSLTMTTNDEYNAIGWKFINTSTHEVIEPLPYRSQGEVDPLNPLLGRYDLKKIIDPGYYNVSLQYELIRNHKDKHVYMSDSEFIVRKN